MDETFDNDIIITIDITIYFKWIGVMNISDTYVITGYYCYYLIIDGDDDGDDIIIKL